ncbi:uncharacterized protein LOC114468879 isoform X1 [Gouania willdenowi]|uniref:Uncharacterized LOC114468879 n=1 Tax=Gouania willdenowi TaxID=441366 RepID=A0A8C5EEU3_GOUWI|nr:uncharacterized protein LOC114468879 isoform X1 [Gouania willdenowi]
MAAVKGVLQTCDPALLVPCGLTDTECDGGQLAVSYLMDSRRVQKVLWRQLFVLDSMMSLLEGLESDKQTQTCPPQQPEGGARTKWKSLKLQSRSMMEETETLLTHLQDKITQIHKRRDTLSALVIELKGKKQLHQQLTDSLLIAHNALHTCEHQLTSLRVESDAALAQLVVQQRIRDQLQACVSALETDTQFHLLSLSQSELSLELRPHPPSHLTSNQLESLRVLLTWSPALCFTLQVCGGGASFLQDYVRGGWAEVSAALLEVMQSYAGQVEMLTEIQALRSSFAIDWRPAQRLLVYLKTASLVCELQVEEGYPLTGRAHLVSVLRDGHTVDLTGLQPPEAKLSLTHWLLFLCSCPII